MSKDAPNTWLGLRSVYGNHNERLLIGYQVCIIPTHTLEPAHELAVTNRILETPLTSIETGKRENEVRERVPANLERLGFSGRLEIFGYRIWSG